MQVEKIQIKDFFKLPDLPATFSCSSNILSVIESYVKHRNPKDVISVRSGIEKVHPSFDDIPLTKKNRNNVDKSFAKP